MSLLRKRSARIILFITFILIIYLFSFVFTFSLKTNLLYSTCSINKCTCKHCVNAKNSTSSFRHTQTQSYGCNCTRKRQRGRSWALKKCQTRHISESPLLNPRPDADCRTLVLLCLFILLYSLYCELVQTAAGLWARGHSSRFTRWKNTSITPTHTRHVRGVFLSFKTGAGLHQQYQTPLCFVQCLDSILRNQRVFAASLIAGWVCFVNDIDPGALFCPLTQPLSPILSSLTRVIVWCLCAHRWFMYSERDRSPVTRGLVIHPTCPNTLWAARPCLSDKRISVKYEETVTDSVRLWG